MAEKMVLPELIQGRVNPHNIAKELIEILNEKNSFIKYEMKKITQKFLNKSDAIHNAAKLITNINETS